MLAMDWTQVDFSFRKQDCIQYRRKQADFYENQQNWFGLVLSVHRKPVIFFENFSNFEKIKTRKPDRFIVFIQKLNFKLKTTHQ
jgi:hypothetical protein